jgi:hypothetical protein
VAGSVDCSVVSEDVAQVMTNASSIAWVSARGRHRCRGRRAGLDIIVTAVWRVAVD